MSEGAGVPDGLADPMPVLHVAAEVADARVEDIAEGVFAQEEIADYAHAPRVSVVHPQSTEIRDGVDGLLGLCHVLVELLEGHASVVADLRHCRAVFFDETYDSFAVVFGDVLGLVLHPLLPFLQIHICIGLLYLGNAGLLLAILVLGDASLLRDHPRLLIEMGAVGDLREYGGRRVVDDGLFPFLFLDEAVEHALVVGLSLGEDVVYLDFAERLAGVLVVVVVGDGEVEDGGALSGLDEHRDVADAR